VSLVGTVVHGKHALSTGHAVWKAHAHASDGSLRQKYSLQAKEVHCANIKIMCAEHNSKSGKY